MADNQDDVGSVETAPITESDHQQDEKKEEEERGGGGGVQEQEQPPPSNEMMKSSEKKIGGTISFSIWPPSLKTRGAVVNRLIETLSNPSALSKRYGSIPHEEASSLARQIEEDSFAAAASDAATSLVGDDGIEILQAYSKEISKRMLDAVKARSAASSAPTTDHNASYLAPPVSATGASEETSSSVEAEP